MAQFDSAPPADFGIPPAGEVPVHFNDHHVYSKPDKVAQRRVLRALGHGATILVPLRSMFEQVGETISYAASTKTVEVSKPGADVKVTVGQPDVVINGESRPLDLLQGIHKGSAVLSIRVTSDGIGGYVQSLPNMRLADAWNDQFVRHAANDLLRAIASTPTLELRPSQPCARTEVA